jgi:uncharacterized protein YkwD
MPHNQKMRKYLLFIVLLSSLSCSKPVSPEAETILSTKEEYLKYVNQARATSRKCGSQSFAATGTVTWNDNLEKAAFLHSKDMFENKYFAHISKSGSDPSARILAQNYPYKSFAENIFTATGFEPSPEEVIQQWLNSPSHCTNIMTPSFKEMAVGRHQNYWTQLFGSK